VKKLLLGLSAAAVLLMSGCSTVQVATPADDNTDYNKIATVENWAKQRGVTVVWVNRPTKSKS
jgi:uncharacterized protein YceK